MKEHKQYNHILAISGDGRNAGKTLLACSIIGKFSRYTPIAGVKITPHKHNDVGEAMLIESGEGILIYRETDIKGIKDTSKMLAAGAIEAYLIQISDGKLPDAFKLLEKHCKPGTLIVCESGRLSAEIQVGISLFVRQLSCKSGKTKNNIAGNSFDRIVTRASTCFDIDLNDITFQQNCWKLNKI